MFNLKLFILITKMKFLDHVILKKYQSLIITIKNNLIYLLKTANANSQQFSIFKVKRQLLFNNKQKRNGSI